MYKKLISLLISIGAVGVIFAAVEENNLANTNSQQVEVQMLVYRVDEPGIDSWFSRIIVADNMIRLDEPLAGGESVGSYTLFELETGNLYNVDLDGPTVLMIEPSQQQTHDIAARIKTQIKDVTSSSDASAVSLKKRELYADGELCMQISVTDGMQFQMARNALNQLYATLALQHAEMLAATPAEYVSACDIAIHLKETDFRYAGGLMMHSQQAQQTEQLVDSSAYELVALSLFQIPENAKLITPQQLTPLH